MSEHPSNSSRIPRDDDPIRRSERLIETTRAATRDYMKTREDTWALLDRAKRICRATEKLVRTTNTLIARCYANLRPNVRPDSPPDDKAR